MAAAESSKTASASQVLAIPENPTFSHFLTSPVLTVIVGTSRTYYLHSDILSAESQRFSGCLKRGPKEPETRAIHIEDEDPELFGFFVEYLYRDQSILSRPVEHYLEYITLARLYAMGKRLMAPVFQECCLWRFTESLGARTSLSDETICELLKLACNGITGRVNNDPLSSYIFWFSGKAFDQLQPSKLFRQLLIDFPESGRQICVWLNRRPPLKAPKPKTLSCHKFGPEGECAATELTQPASPITISASPVTEPASPFTEPASPVTEPASPVPGPASATAGPASATTRPRPALAISDLVSPVPGPASATTRPRPAIAISDLVSPVPGPASATARLASATTRPRPSLAITEPASPVPGPASATTRPRPSLAIAGPASATTRPRPSLAIAGPASATTRPRPSLAIAGPASATTRPRPISTITKLASLVPRSALATTRPALATIRPRSAITKPRSSITKPASAFTRFAPGVTKSTSATTRPALAIARLASAVTQSATPTSGPAQQPLDRHQKQDEIMDQSEN